MMLSVTVSVRGIGRGAYDGILGDAFHMQWLALALVLGAYYGFVRRKPIAAGAFLGVAAWVHPLVALHGAFCVAVGGLLSRTPGLVDTLKAGIAAVLVSLPASVSVINGAMGQEDVVLDSQIPLVMDTALFRTPHHYDLELLPFLLAALLGLLAVSAIPRIAARETIRAGRFYGLLAGQSLLLLATFLLHGPLFFQDRPPGAFWIFALDLSRTTPLFFALCGVAAAAALPGPEERFSTGEARGIAHRVFAFSAMLACGVVLLLNFGTRVGAGWMLLLAMVSLVTYGAVRKGMVAKGAAAVLVSFSALAVVGFVRGLEIRTVPDPPQRALYAWARGETSEGALFLVPPGMEAFRLEARRSVYVDFKSFPPSQPALGWDWRQRLEEIVDYDAKALETARGWPGIYWWDRAYAKRNPPRRIAELLTSTGADFFVQDRLYRQLPPHLPSDDAHSEWPGLTIAYENSRYRVYRLEAIP
jgi:hypothetical protein